MDSELVKVCICYRMSKRQCITAENVIFIDIEKFHFDLICWSTNMECVSGVFITSMLQNLVSLQGYEVLDGWNIELC